MTTTDVYTLLPLIAIALAPVVVLLLISFHRDHQVTFLISLSMLVIAFATLPLVGEFLPRQITPLIVMDGPGIFFTGLLLATSFAAIMLSYGYLDRYEGHQDEYYVLILLATLGSILLVMSNHFISFFLGLEILSVSLYALIAYPRLQRQRIEAAIKYLILAGATSAFLLFGMAMIYAVTGTLEFAPPPAAGGFSENPETLLLVGWGMLTVGAGFKLALVPFHMWTPDVYQGAPAPVTGFIATVSKGGIFVILLRYFSVVNFYEIEALWTMFAIIAMASMLLGNLLALLQSNVKRILAYSSIAHLGYLMVAFLASGSFATQAVAFYLAAYFVTNLCAFGVVTVLSTHEREVEELAEYHGLFWRQPRLALILTAALLSLAGIPPSAGLIGKIYVAAAGVESALWLLLIVLVIGSVIGVFYYLRVVIAMFRQPEGELAAPAATPSFSSAGGMALLALTVALVGLGIFPTPLMRVIAGLVIGIR